MSIVNKILLLGVTFLLFSCGNNTSSRSSVTSIDELRKSMDDERVEVMFFHNHERCSSCLNMEKYTKDVVDTYFAQQVNDGGLVLLVIDIEDKNNSELTIDYQVIWTSLYVNKWENGKEDRHNMTEFAFLNVDSDPEAFKEGLRKQIEELL